MTPDSVAEFTLSITKALADQLAEALDSLAPCPLTSRNLDDLEERPGVYVLFLDGRRVYVGKAEKALPGRLEQHLRKVSGRSGLSLDRMGFVCVYVDKDMDSIAPERMLIARYGSRGGVPWNSNGFGNKDPGRRRDHSLVKINHFDVEYSIDLETPVILSAAEVPVWTALRDLKKTLPFIFRYDTSTQGKAIMKAASVAVSPAATTFRAVIEEIMRVLPAGWQTTALPGYAILYREREAVEYLSAAGYWRKAQSGDVVWRAGASQHDPSRAPIPVDSETERGDAEPGDDG
ncbi:hypothetical protein MXD61_23755 [Frankia sp. AgPm24]|uniref:hypothetical protein n=1 Tax=Frankia sp. AgPm24 TaxID=631128 RepID=UPI00200DF777|nr:hypothetical protein [Frankia sp. AgPm24]MCK9924845.1 hypothetical protein [Frankia sp. AgPm24]